MVNNGGPRELTGALALGTTVVDGFTQSVRFVGLWTVLPWILASLVVVGAGVAYWRVRQRRKSAV